MQLFLKSYEDVLNYAKTKTSIIIPVGSTEQHSKVGYIGTDFIIADEIAKAIGEKTNTLVSPVLSFGMANHHLEFPGTISLNPSTYILVIKDIVSSLSRHGFNKFYFVNGHGGNIGPAQSAFSEISRNENLQFKIMSWWNHSDVMDYIKDIIGDRDGHHATVSELSITKYFYEQDFKKTDSSYNIEKKDHHWPLSPVEFKKQYPDGRMESDPSLVDSKKGKLIFDKAVEILSEDFTKFDQYEIK